MAAGDPSRGVKRSINSPPDPSRGVKRSINSPFDPSRGVKRSINSPFDPSGGGRTGGDEEPPFSFASTASRPNASATVNPYQQWRCTSSARKSRTGDQSGTFTL